MASSRIFISDSIGQVSAELTKGRKTDSVYVFAHGAGAGMNHPFMTRLSKELAELGVAVLRFNFPYMEKGSKRPDVAAVAEKTVLRAIEHATEKFSDVPIFAGGKSFGGRMTSQLLSKNPDIACSGLVFVGFPLHPAGKPGVDRAEHLKNVKIPMLFLQGTRDALAEINLIRQVVGSLPHATLEELEGADHSFRSGKKDLIPSLAEIMHTWMKNRTK
jgi:predicted alpha/beta-hydrolase family hydrolase